MALKNQGGNTMAGINKAADELKDQAMNAHKSTDILELVKKVSSYIDNKQRHLKKSSSELQRIFAQE